MASEETPANGTPDEEARSDADLWIDAITRMIQLTQSGEMQWKAGRAASPGTGEVTTPPYFATHKGRTYRLEERFVKASRPRNMGQFLEAFGVGAPKDRYVVDLDLVDEDGLSLYSVPRVSPLRDLMDTVQKHTTADGALRDLLED